MGALVDGLMQSSAPVGSFTDAHAGNLFLINGTIWAFNTSPSICHDRRRSCNATLFYALNLYRNAFTSLRMGYASAQAGSSLLL
jgi:ABC-type sugar transport system permease subunit